VTARRFPAPARRPAHPGALTTRLAADRPVAAERRHGNAPQPEESGPGRWAAAGGDHGRAAAAAPGPNPGVAAALAAATGPNPGVAAALAAAIGPNPAASAAGRRLGVAREPGGRMGLTAEVAGAVAEGHPARVPGGCRRLA
jgi:hypothetical protein